MDKLLIATTNEHKIKEIAAIFAEAGITDWEIIGLNNFPDYQPPEEDGQTFAENAMIKALAAAKMSGLLTLADDSGLTVEALNGEPGVYSARYADAAGQTHDDAANRHKLLANMRDIPDGNRQAAFVCAAALATPEEEAFFLEGRCEGEIAHEERGSNGFGYDCLFYLPQLGKTMAELDEEEKNAISHRGAAMRKIAQIIKK